MTEAAAFCQGFFIAENPDSLANELRQTTSEVIDAWQTSSEVIDAWRQTTSEVIDAPGVMVFSRGE